MTPDSLFQELHNFLSLLLRSEVAISTTNIVQLQASGGFQRITWSNNSAVPGELFRSDSSTVSEYRDWINWQGYSAVLLDGSFIQVSYDFQYSELVGHRLLYFPCPFDLEIEFLDDLSLPELVSLYLEQGIDQIRLRTPVRFDYDPNAISETHPASHMTFQWSHSRIPVMSPLSPGHFIQFVFQNFYPFLWSTHSFLKEWPRVELEPTISREERSALHLSS